MNCFYVNFQVNYELLWVMGVLVSQLREGAYYRLFYGKPKSQSNLMLMALKRIYLLVI